MIPGGWEQVDGGRMKKWPTCAGEGGTCHCGSTSSPAMVAYGAKYAHHKPGYGTLSSGPTEMSANAPTAAREVTGSVVCSNGGIGEDPAHGYYKVCKCEPKPKICPDISAWWW